MSVPVLLLQNGVFPGSPCHPRTGVSLKVLDSYQAYFERSGDAVTALAAALCTVYRRRGFPADDPFRSALTQAIQWSSLLRLRLKRRLDSFLQDAAAVASATAEVLTADASAPSPFVADSSASDHIASSIPNQPSQEKLKSPAPQRAARTLRERCPACFGLTTWGRPLGGDIQMGADGNWSLRHLRSAGDGPELPFSPAYFVSKAEVDSVRQQILTARSRKPHRNTSSVSLQVIEACQESFQAAKEKKEKADPDHYDSTGVFVMTCRHSQVIFLANIDTPGEQQCYIIALLDKVASFLPRNATIVQAYDVGCVVDHSCHLYPLLPPSLHQRVAFVINIMHSFVHEWDCQLVYSPRFFTGMGLSDMEGVERFWSQMRKLIGMTQTQWVRELLHCGDIPFIHSTELMAPMDSGWTHRVH
ncbi:unnamed protein product [Mycena citricolor]|uniref:CxC1-like cysteine cluster associated with KDZ transposases domain-containing protein n=1 Tax=Mycena citricolor TaxID=2018698 RepID=A0AAD2Q2K0_9AGAR|nr:unnamed protein product [Mycena citricolor]